MANTLGMERYDYVEFYVGSAKMVAFWFAKALGMRPTAYLGPESGHRDRCSYLLESGKLKFLITSSIDPENYDVSSFVQRHGDGVKRWAVSVKDVEAAYTHAMNHGAVSVRPPLAETDADGIFVEARLRIYDDTEICLMDASAYKGIFRPGFIEPVQSINVDASETGLLSVDHIVGNVRINEMAKWADYFNTVFDFETFVDFGPGDISTKYSALLSKVVRSKDSVVKNPINEPFKGLKKSQIQEYIDAYHGSGIQHIAITTGDIVKSIAALRRNGIEFLDIPKTYYEDLRSQNVKLDENIDDLEAHGILCDTKDVTGVSGYLLQLFTKPIGDRPTFFFEIIQRKHGAQGFGQGNFQSLFESIERDQARRGNF